MTGADIRIKVSLAKVATASSPKFKYLIGGYSLEFQKF